MKRKTRSDKDTAVGAQEYQLGWTRQEAGWYTHPELGGIVGGRGSWWYYPRSLDDDPGETPYKTLLAAQRAAAELAKGEVK